MTDDLVVYVSDQTHSSFARAARILGFRPEQVRVLPVDERFGSTARLLAAAMDADRRARAGGRSSSRANGGRDEHRRRRSAAASSPTSAASGASGCTSTPRTADSPCSTERGRAQLARPRRAPTRSRSTRTSGSTSPTSAAACSSTRLRPLAGALRDHPGLPEGRDRERGRDQLRRPRHAADAVRRGP